MSHVLLLHGIDSTPQDNWFPWLRTELENQGHTVTAPHLPTHNDLQPEEWISQVAKKPDIIIAHSLGCVVALKLLEKWSMDKAILVAPVWGPSDHQYTHIVDRFVSQDFDFDLIRENCSKIHILHGNDDPYTPLEQVERLAKELGTDIEIVERGRHLNADAGYEAFPRIVEFLDSKSL